MERVVLYRGNLRDGGKPRFLLLVLVGDSREGVRNPKMHCMLLVILFCLSLALKGKTLQGGKIN